MPKSSRMLGATFVGITVRRGGGCSSCDKSPRSCEETATWRRSCGPADGELLLKTGGPRSWDETRRFLSFVFGNGELWSGSGLSVGSFRASYVGTGVNGEAVGRLGERRCVGGLLGSCCFAT
jgi:hypothetical protein